MSPERPNPPSGVLVVDKPRGPTSHDVVAKARRALRTREIGHAGTLDPMATGVLVLAIGEATKLVPYLTADSKRYVAQIRFGAETDTLDAEGTVTATADVPPLSRELVEQALLPFVGEHDQRAPVVSAIKVGGEALHRRVRRGEDVEAPIRRVVLHEVVVRAVDADTVELDLYCGKGFYVRSLARDLAHALGTLGHLVALRRTASGDFAIGDAVGFDALVSREEDARSSLVARLVSLPDAVRALPRGVLSEAGVRDARHGKPIRRSDVTSDVAFALGATVGLLDPNGELVAMATVVDAETLRVLRGFRAPDIGRTLPTPG